MSHRALILFGFLGALALLAGPDPTDSSAKPKPGHKAAKRQSVTATISGKKLRVIGNRRGNAVTLRLRRKAPKTLEVDLGDNGSADFRFARKRFKKIEVVGKAGDDSVRIDDSRGVFTDGEATTIRSGDGNDTLLGGAGPENLQGDAGQDLIDGGPGDDLTKLGAGNDVFRWDSGDGSDTVEGEAGVDGLLCNGTGAAEGFDVVPNGQRVRLSRSLDGTAIDTGGLETVDLAALGGTDTITVVNLAGTGLTRVSLDLELIEGGGSGDGQPDRVTLHAGAGEDTVAIAGGAPGVSVGGLGAPISILRAAGGDALTVNGQGGGDTIDAAGLAAGSLLLTLDGGAGVDRFSGSPAGDAIDAGPDDDFVRAGAGDDLLLLGAGDDTARWDSGDGSDTLEGQAGAGDRLLFNGSNADENVDLSASGERLRLRDIGAATLDVNDLERVDYSAGGGADEAAVGSLAGTAVKELDVDLAGVVGGGNGDGLPDNVILNASNGDDVITLAGSSAGVSVSGVGPGISIVRAEAAADRLTVNALGGNDVVDASGVAAGSIALTLNGGDLDDVAIGGAGDDVLTGGAGDDVLIGGPGVDALDGGPGSNVVIQD